MPLADEFREFAGWAERTAPAYARLARAVADDPDLLALAERVPAEKSAPHLLLAAVHDSLLADPDHELAAWYPTVVDASPAVAADQPRDPDAQGLLAAFADCCAEREDELRATFETRRTQTNAVGRTAALYPAITRVALDAGRAPALIEVGPSAGLNLLFDRFGYEYERTGGDDGTSDGTGDGTDDVTRDGTDRTVQRVGADDSPVTIRSEVRAGEPPVPSAPPPLACRIGVDLDPLDPADPDDRRWIRALAWPEHERRHEVLEPALELAAADPPRVVAGDATERLPALVDDVPPDVPVCVVNTLVLDYVSDEARAEFEATLAELGQERELYWLSGEGEHDEFDDAIPLTYARPGAGESRRLGTFEMHGRWLRWGE